MTTARPSLAEARRLIARALTHRADGQPRPPHRLDARVRALAPVLAALLAIDPADVPARLRGGDSFLDLDVLYRAQRLTSRAYSRAAAFERLADEILLPPAPAPTPTPAAPAQAKDEPASRYVVPCAGGCGRLLPAPSAHRPAARFCSRVARAGSSAPAPALRRRAAEEPIESAIRRYRRGYFGEVDPADEARAGRKAKAKRRRRSPACLATEDAATSIV